MMYRILTAIGFLGLGPPAMAHEYVTPEEYNAAFGIDLENSEDSDLPGY